MSSTPSTTCPQCAYTRSAQDSNPAWQCPKCGVAYSKAQRDKTRRKPYIPNSIPTRTRAFHVGASLLLLAYGSYSLGRNSLYLPTKIRKYGGPYRRYDYLHLQDAAAWLMVAAFVCAAALMLSVVLDHYDERNNEAYYQRAAQVLRWLGWSFFILALLRHMASR